MKSAGETKAFTKRNEITTGLSLQALFWSTGAVMHVVAAPESPPGYFKESETISTCLTDAQLLALVTFLKQSFAYDAQGKLRQLKPGLYGDSQFYEAFGRYSVLNTCNTWTAKGLKSAGVDLSPGLALTASGVMRAIQTQKVACSPRLR